MNVEYLRLFVKIAATNNISLAGKDLGLSAAVSSAHISKLEQSLGVKLIHRTTRKVSLTPEGQDFLPHAEEVLASVESARAAVGAGSVIPQGTLRVTAPASFGRMHIVPNLAGFLALYPKLKVDLRLSDTIIDMVEGGYDIAVRNAALNDSSLVARKLARDKRIVCASPDYIAKHDKPNNPTELINHQCINLIGLEHWSFKTPQGTQTIKNNYQLRADNGEAVRDACVAGIGITICSTWCGYKQLQTGELVQVLDDYPLESDTAIWAVYPSSRLLAPKVRAFIDYFVDCFGDRPYWEV